MINLAVSRVNLMDLMELEGHIAGWHRSGVMAARYSASIERVAALNAFLAAGSSFRDNPTVNSHSELTMAT